ncbi:hypothetical protein H2248_006409 [Termitomyces sp. 'cryptogamus']|nr:hypothetical protein H2248_006409 [Termitomyces sp. 'cryptogamus']
MSGCQSLSPPPPPRHRASSITIRSTLSLNSLGRRRSNSCLQSTPQDTSPTATSSAPIAPESISTAVPPPSMLIIVASRFLQWLHFQPKQHLSWSTPSSSPRSSSEDYVLPLSASAARTSFGDEVHQEPPQTQGWRHGFLAQHTSIILVVMMFPVSTALVVLCLSTLPISLAWPRTLADVAQLGRELHGYTQSGPGPVAHVMGVMAISAVWKHAWSIPGSVIWNVLGGALFSPAYATILLTTLTMLGSACATLLAMPLAPFLTHFFPRALDMTRNALEGASDADEASAQGRSSPWVRLSVLRLIGVVPWSGINIACGVCGVSMTDCMLGAFIGCLPWTAVTCQIGDILQTVASTPSPSPQSISDLLTTPDIILKLIFLSFLSLAPILARDRLRLLISSPRHISAEEKTRWAWVQQWRTKLRSKSLTRMQQREQSLKELAVLVEEKRALELPS